VPTQLKDRVDGVNCPGASVVMLYVRRLVPFPRGWCGNLGGVMALINGSAAAQKTKVRISATQDVLPSRLGGY
jgi:hypothetical protein